MKRFVKLLTLGLVLTFFGLGMPVHVQAQSLNKDHFKAVAARSIGPAGMSGRVTSIDVVLDHPETIYIGTASGGVWRSKSGGVSWEPLFEEQPVLSIGAVCIQQSNPDVVWAGTGEGNPRNSQTSGAGIYKTIDGGKTWKLMGLENTKTIHRIVVHRDNPDIVYVAAMGSAWGPNPERGVYRTKDGGETWEKVLYNNELTGAADLVVDPSNPNKIFAAMWEYQRWPWFFTSGGSGSGLYVSHDGGDTWEKRTEKNGLPEGEIGRIGLSIAASKTNVVYALVESKKTALYRSDDGGVNWKVTATKNIGNRPFYYADIFVDPHNENRIFNLWSFMTKSEDGGKTFETVMPYSGYHPDHHAFWMSPNDPNFIIEGNDGGLHISHDRGENWRFVENLPLAQFYHINIDNDVPYNVYGGMQDNGSWVGPAYSWRSGGIRNADWSEVLFGDGFDVMPFAGDNRYGFAMYQGGNVNLYDKETGATQYIQPRHPDGIPLRFNWNAALAQNPSSDCGIYFGSQFLHKSLDCGSSWEIISPDLTTNDTAKQKQALSGGLTIDATRAENYTSITAIAPSALNDNVIWVGTDDGNVQVTKDGGKNWTNVASKLPGLPAGSWIPQIVASTHSANEAYVVANNYRLNDWKPYAYKTTNGGKSWSRIASPEKVNGHCHTIVQDPLVANLLFLGTEHGLYFSIDGGSSWEQFTFGFPSVATTDLKIHPREHDLVAATFGRSAFVVDNISWMRDYARAGKTFFDADFKSFATADAYLANYASAKGVRFTADAHFIGKNKRNGALLTFWINPKLKQGDNKLPEKMNVAITNASGDTIRKYTTKVDTGMNRRSWNLRHDGLLYPNWNKPAKDANAPSGREVSPGTYTVHFSIKDHSGSTQVNVLNDPRIELNAEAIQQQKELYARHDRIITTATAIFDRLREAKETVNHLSARVQYADTAMQDSLTNTNTAILDSIKQMQELFFAPQDFEGYDHITQRLNNYLWGSMNYFSFSPIDGKISPMSNIALKDAERELLIVLERSNRFFAVEWPKYKALMEAQEDNPFKPYEPIAAPQR